MWTNAWYDINENLLSKYGSVHSFDFAPSVRRYFECSVIVVQFMWSEMRYDGDLY